MNCLNLFLVFAIAFCNEAFAEQSVTDLPQPQVAQGENTFLEGNNYLDAVTSDVDVTVYQNGVSLIRDTRYVSLFKGYNRILFNNVSPNFIADSVLVSPNKQGEFSVFEYNFINRDLTRLGLLSRSIGYDVIITESNKPSNTDTSKAKLIHYDDSEVTVKFNGKVAVMPINSIAFTEAVIRGLGRTAFEVLVDATSTGRVQVDLCYLAHGLRWQPRYKVEVSNDFSYAVFRIYAQLHNESDWSIKNVNLKLDSSSPHLKENPEKSEQKDDLYKSTDGKLSYFSPLKMNILKKSLKMVHIKSANVKNPRKGYLLTIPSKILYKPNLGGSELSIQNVIILKNDKASGLGINMSSGVGQIFKVNKDNTDFIGEQNIDILRENEGIPIVIETEKSVSAKFFQTDFRFLSDKTIEIGGRLIISNLNSIEKVVRVVCGVRDNSWEINRESEKHLIHHKSCPTWDMMVPANGEVALKFKLILGIKQR